MVILFYWSGYYTAVRSASLLNIALHTPFKHKCGGETQCRYEIIPSNNFHNKNLDLHPQSNPKTETNRFSMKDFTEYETLRHMVKV